MCGGAGEGFTARLPAQIEIRCWIRAQIRASVVRDRRERKRIWVEPAVCALARKTRESPCARRENCAHRPRVGAGVRRENRPRYVARERVE